MSSTDSNNKALTLRAVIIGAVGSVILTASSLFIALRMGMLPWPISFAAIASVLALKLFKSNNLHEANVMHAAMSAGSMIAGGLAFTIPGLWIMGLGQDLAIHEVLIAAFAGTIVGLVACAAFQPYFIREKKLAYPIGTAAADTLTAVGNNGAEDAPALFWGLGLSGAYAAVRDVLHLIPAILFKSDAIPGVVLGIYNSPMSIAMGFAVGVVPTAVWFIGAAVGHLGIVGALPAAGMVETATALDIRTSLGLGLMLGAGAGTIVASTLRNKKMRSTHSDEKPMENAASATPSNNTNTETSMRLSTSPRIIAIVCALAVALICTVLQLSILVSTVAVAATWFCIYLSAWLTGTTGINPMEVFGMLVLLLVQALFRITSMKLLFLIAAMVAVACGIGGDVMNDLKAGDRLATNPKDQMTGMIVGALVGVVVASLLLMGMYQVYGGNAFGPQSTFVAVQAANVAAMAGGIAHLPAFIAGLGIGGILAACGLPVMTLGLGVYLPFYMSCGAAIGATLKFVLEKTGKLQNSKADSTVSGILGGESLVGVLIALVALFSFMR
ncbi:OPT/YSL family transporter [Atopobium fossor]|uniref:OPT/YSL family transporter n=1 Tax=Atopobium fossor TaxID=39487 RepID=UPI000415B67D|nr:OPT/YSL family transporter [Atopobium fossor]